MYHHLCPRCGMAFQSGNPYTYFVFFRLRYILAPFAVIFALMSTGVWLHSRFTVEEDTYTEDAPVNSTASNIPHVVARQDDHTLLQEYFCCYTNPATKPTPVTQPSLVTQSSSSLTNVELVNQLQKHHYEDRFPRLKLTKGCQKDGI